MLISLPGVCVWVGLAATRRSGLEGAFFLIRLSRCCRRVGRVASPLASRWLGLARRHPP